MAKLFVVIWPNPHLHYGHYVVPQCPRLIFWIWPNAPDWCRGRNSWNRIFICWASFLLIQKWAGFRTGNHWCIPSWLHLLPIDKNTFHSQVSGCYKSSCIWLTLNDPVEINSKANVEKNAQNWFYSTEVHLKEQVYRLFFVTSYNFLLQSSAKHYFARAPSKALLYNTWVYSASDLKKLTICGHLIFFLFSLISIECRLKQNEVRQWYYQ